VFLEQSGSQQEQKPLDINANLAINLAPGLVLQGQSVQANNAGRVYVNTGNLNMGAM
jgi:hypothetical protein